MVRYEARLNDDGDDAWWEEVLSGFLPGWDTDSGALFVPVAPGQVAALVAARREADTCVRTLRCALEDCGLVFPELCPSVDAAGGPVVTLGTVDLATARCLALALSGHHPPGPRPETGAGTDTEDRAA
ncbi:MAG: hypothetical protein QG608_1438 [Actinomycetota bacterium]|nr:hypothetical protein [Actinomycetota bacterium]